MIAVTIASILLFFSTMDYIPIVSQVKSIVQCAQGDVQGAKKTQVKFLTSPVPIVIASAAATPVALMGAVGALGFTASGIAAGSWGAGLMASYGGAVASGSLCSVLQSIGAAGLPAVVSAMSAAGGAGLATGAFYGVKGVFTKKDDDNPVVSDSIDEPSCVEMCASLQESTEMPDHPSIPTLFPIPENDSIPLLTPPESPTLQNPFYRQ
jgi:hypothetical protein